MQPRAQLSTVKLKPSTVDNVSLPYNHHRFAYWFIALVVCATEHHYATRMLSILLTYTYVYSPQC